MAGAGDPMDRTEAGPRGPEPVGSILGRLGAADDPGVAVRLRGAAAPEGTARIDRFVDPREIGRGGMGVVYLAIDPDLGRSVAIKVLLPPARRRRVHVFRFLREARIAGQLEHPNIAPVYDVGELPDGSLFMAMQLVRGRSLAEILGRYRRAEGAEASKVRRALLGQFLKVCDAVEYAHSRGVVHRDLKPANVMIGHFGEVQVLDWGIAKVLDGPEDREGDSPAPESAIETTEGSMVGTPLYMSPEQAAGRSGEIDARTDVYALGTMLYEMLAFQPAFEPEALPNLVARIRSGNVVPPSVRSPGAEVPRELDAVVARAMAPDRSARYASVADLRADVEAFLAGRVLSAADYSPAEILLKWARRHRRVLAGVAAALVALAAGIGVVRWRDRSERAASARASFEAGLAAWDRAERTAPFHPGAPEEYFRTRLAALAAMGGGLEAHPDPGDAWRKELAARADEVQEKAQASRDWSVARGVVESAAAWKAIDATEREARLGRVDAAAEDALRRDREDLDRVLERIRRAEEATRSGHQGFFLPGEIEERALRLARATGPGLTTEVLSRLDAATGLERRFLIEVLGRKGDVVARPAGRDAASRVARALEAPDAFDTDELVAWLGAAARLEAAAPGSVPGLGPATERLLGSFAWSGPVRAALERVRRQLAAIADLPRDPAALDREIVERADRLAARAGSGRAFTREVLERLAGPGARSIGEVRLLHALLGLRADPLPPDPERPGFAAIPLLGRAVATIDGDWFHGAPGDEAARRERNRQLELAISAIHNLSRLGDRSLLAIRTRTHRSPEADRFRSEIRLALALLDDRADLVEGVDPFELGLERLARFDVEGAERALDAALERDPSNAAILTRRGQARIRQGRLDEARADLERSLRLDPDDGLAHAVYATYLLRVGDLEGAAAEAGIALRLDPGLAGAHAVRAQAAKRRGDLAAALADEDAAIALDPSDPQAWSQRATTLLWMGRPAESIRDATRALELDPWLAGALAVRGLARQLTGDPRGAIDDGSRAIRMRPDLVDAHHARGLSRIGLGDVAGGLEDLDRAVALAPQDAKLRLNRGTARLQRGDLDLALEDLDRAVALDPRFAQAYAQRGAVRQQQGDLAAALAEYDRAIGLEPGRWDAWSNRGTVLARLGRREEAARSFAEALARCPADRRAAILALRRRHLGD